MTEFRQKFDDDESQAVLKFVLVIIGLGAIAAFLYFVVVIEVFYDGHLPSPLARRHARDRRPFVVTQENCDARVGDLRPLPGRDVPEPSPQEKVNLTLDLAACIKANFLTGIVTEP